MADVKPFLPQVSDVLYTLFYNGNGVILNNTYLRCSQGDTISQYQESYECSNHKEDSGSNRNFLLPIVRTNGIIYLCIYSCTLLNYYYRTRLVCTMMITEVMIMVYGVRYRKQRTLQTRLKKIRATIPAPSAENRK